MLLSAGALIVLGAGIGIGTLASRQSTDGNDAAASTSGLPSQGSQPSPQSPAETCSLVIMDALQQTVDAVDAGQSGLDLQPLLFQYGSESDIYRIAVQAQGQLLSNSIQQGHPSEQREKLRPYVTEQCAQNSTGASAPPSSAEGFPWVEPPTVTDGDGSVWRNGLGAIPLTE